ncbi:potassium channel family protein [Candidatus Pacearchaeota archaeon]|nr:potassium channel family protein [Candidatus Pacearchaeota archaeon]
MEKERRREFQIILGSALSVLAIGTVIYHFVEHWTWLDSLYFSVVTLATVGYGDLSPHTAAGKIFTMIYIITGIGIILEFVNALTKRRIERRLKNEK